MFHKYGLIYVILVALYSLNIQGGPLRTAFVSGKNEKIRADCSI